MWNPVAKLFPIQFPMAK